MSNSSSKLPKIKVLRSYNELSTPALVAFAYGTRFSGDPLAINPPVNDNTMRGYAATLNNTHNSRQINPSKTLTSNEKAQRQILITALNKDAAYLEGVANDAAIAAGDVEAGKAVVSRIGYTVAAKGGGKHHVGVTHLGPGWLQATEAKIKKGAEGHVWEFGITTAKGTPPTAVKDHFTLEVSCIFNNLTSGTIFAYRHASVTGASGQNGSGGGGAVINSGNGSQRSSLLPASFGKHPVIDTLIANPYNFGDWRYAVVP